MSKAAAPVPLAPLAERADESSIVGSQKVVERGWSTDFASSSGSAVSRRTAESEVVVQLALDGRSTVSCEFDVAASIHVDGLADLLQDYAGRAGLSIDVTFRATRLSSSHVVAEDVGMAIGKAIRVLAIERITNTGIQGAGSNVETPCDLQKPVRVGVSMEGRKFWKYVPLMHSYSKLRHSFLVGHTLSNGVFSEDLDDFIDGFAGGLSASVIVHLGMIPTAEDGWRLIFQSLGEATSELLSVNVWRRAVTPGVKATLA